jgi:membrane protease YdiL (CAAX protease family)
MTVEAEMAGIAVADWPAPGELKNSSRGWALLATPPLAAMLVATLVGLGAVTTALSIKPTAQQIRQFVASLPQQYDIQMGLTVGVYLSILFAIWIVLPKRGVASLKSYFRAVPWSTVGLALCSGVVFAVGIGSTLVYLAEHKVVAFHTTAGERAMLPHTLGQLLVGLLAVAVVGPLVEEVYFRGLLLRWLQTKMPLVVAAFPNAALFAAIHFRFSTHVGPEGWVLTAGLFVFGLFASAWAGALRSVWPSFAAHGMYNATLISLPVLASWS